MADTIKFKRGTYDKIKDYTPDQGEPIYDKTRKSLRMGNGSDPVSDLPEIKGILENPADADVLDAGVIGWDKTRNILKFGDGASEWASLEENKAIPETWVNVKDFGAVGDGVTDDSAAIQKAIDALQVSSTNAYWGSLYEVQSEVLYFPKGIYRINNTINLNASIDIYGDNALILIDDSITAFYISGIANLNISNIIFAGSNTSNTAVAIKMATQNLDQSRINITNCIFRNLKHAIVFYGMNNSTILNISQCRFTQTNDVFGYENDGTNDGRSPDVVNIRDCWFSLSAPTVGKGNITLSSSFNVNIENNLFVPLDHDGYFIAVSYNNKLNIKNNRFGGESGGRAIVSIGNLGDRTVISITDNFIASASPDHIIELTDYAPHLQIIMMNNNLNTTFEIEDYIVYFNFEDGTTFEEQYKQNNIGRFLYLYDTSYWVSNSLGVIRGYDVNANKEISGSYFTVVVEDRRVDAHILIPQISVSASNQLYFIPGENIECSRTPPAQTYDAVILPATVQEYHVGGGAGSTVLTIGDISSYVSSTVYGILYIYDWDTGYERRTRLIYDNLGNHAWLTSRVAKGYRAVIFRLDPVTNQDVDPSNYKNYKIIIPRSLKYTRIGIAGFEITKAPIPTYFAYIIDSTRPLNPGKGMMMFDLNLGKPIWYNGETWIDATGTTV